MQWLRYLPHAYNDTLGIWNIACSGEGKSQLFEYLYKDLTARAQTKATSPHFVVFLYDECGFQSHPIAKFVAQAKELGVTFVFFADTAARIGRSLGVHLILATQKPSGQVNEQIWSNSRFKLCLKVQSPVSYTHLTLPTIA